MENKKEYPYAYFVSFTHTGCGIAKETGSGMARICRKQPIKSYEDVVSLKTTIENNGFTDVVILNYKRLEGELHG